MCRLDVGSLKRCQSPTSRSMACWLKAPVNLGMPSVLCGFRALSWLAALGYTRRQWRRAGGVGLTVPQPKRHFEFGPVATANHLPFNDSRLCTADAASRCGRSFSNRVGGGLCAGVALERGGGTPLRQANAHQRERWGCPPQKPVPAREHRQQVRYRRVFTRVWCSSNAGKDHR